jgi:hypothetical protein
LRSWKLNRNQLKYLAIAAMVIDHVAAVYVPAELLVGQLMRFVGCLTGPCMAFFLAEGYLHTRDLRKYGLRLAIFALLSWPPFSLFQTGRALFPAFGVIYTLFLGYLAILLWDKGRMAKGWKTVCTVLLCLVSMPGDWALFDVLCPLLLFLNRDRPSRKWKLFALLAVLMMLLAVDWGKPLWTSAYVLGIPLVVILLKYGYNGLPGSKKPFHKWVFYIFYPAHLLILALLRWHFAIGF